MQPSPGSDESSKATNGLSFCRLKGCLLSLNHRGETPSNIPPSTLQPTLGGFELVASSVFDVSSLAEA